MTKIRIGMFAVGFLLSVFPTAGFAGFQPTAEQRSACMGDALRLCSAVLPDTDRIVSCLASKKSQLAPQCRAHFEQR
jgi:hypothetical protein